MSDNFIVIPFSRENLDRYFIRCAILSAINKNMKNFSGKFLDVGCGKMPYKEYILSSSEVQEYVGLDIEDALVYDKNIGPDFQWDGKKMPFRENSFNCAFATEVLEHCPEPDVVLSEIFRVLKPGGVFFFTVPFLWNLHEIPKDEFRYTPFSLERYLKNAGFNELEIKATGGWHSSLAQMLGLWVRRSPISKRKKNLLSYIVKPMMKYLIQADKPAEVTFKEGQMITGLYGLAKKN